MREKLPQIVLSTTDFGPGGITRMIETLVRRLPDAGFTPFVVLSKPPQQTARLQRMGIPWRYVPPESTLSYMTSLLRDASVVHIHSPFQPFIAESAQSIGVPVIETVHNVEAWQCLPFIASSVCVSKAVQKRQRFPERTVVIRNGVDLPPYPQFQDSLRKREKRWGRSPLVLLEAGRSDRERFARIEEILVALSTEVRQVRCLVLGREGDGAVEPSRLTGRLPIEYLGWQDDPSIAFKEADLFIHLPISEAFGLSTAEAMSWGLVPIVTRVGGLPELVRDGVDGYVIDPGNKQEMLVAAVHRILEFSSLEPRGRHSMAIEARRRVGQMCSAAEMVRQYIELYDELVHTGSSSTDIATDQKRAQFFFDSAQKAYLHGDVHRGFLYAVEGLRGGGYRSQFYQLLGSVYLRGGLFADAVCLLRVSAFLDPSSEHVRKMLVVALFKSGRVSEARAVLTTLNDQRIQASTQRMNLQK